MKTFNDESEAVAEIESGEEMNHGARAVMDSAYGADSSDDDDESEHSGHFCEREALESFWNGGAYRA